MRNLWKRMLLLGFGCWMLSALLFSIPGLDSLEWNVLDVWATQIHGKVRDNQNISQSVAVIEIDEGLFENQHLSWPLDKNIYGELLDYLDTMGAKAAVFDLLFTENLSDCGKGDELFLGMLQYFPNTVITFGGLVETSMPSPETFIIPQRFHFGQQVGDLLPMFGAILPYPELLQVAPRLAANNLKSMSDGIDRRVPLFMRDGSQLVPGMGLMGAMLTQLNTDGAYPNWKWMPGKKCFQTNTKCIPVDAKGNLYPSFQDSIPEFNLSDVRTSQAAFFRGEASAIGREQLEGRVVYIGASAPSLGDLGSTPLSGLSRMGKTPNVLMHARAAHSIISEFAMRPWVRMEVLLASLFLVFVALLIYLLAPVQIALLANLGIMVLGPFLSYYAYREGYLYPILEILVAQVLVFGCGLWQAFRERDDDHRYLERTFSTYLSKDVIKDMALNRENPQLGGEEVEGSALFSDIQGFSSFAEQMTPRQLVAMLNEYFEEMTKVLLEHGATVDKFIGDAIVAFWGAPRACPDHQRRAVESALAMQKALDKLRAEWSSRSGIPEGFKRMRMRIGVNSGRFVVGNMGCTTRMHYTMMGDTVNLAARLETISGKYGVALLIGSDTFQILDREAYTSRKVDIIRVKGRTAPEHVYEVMGEPRKQELCNLYNRAFDFYQKGDFGSALEHFSACKDLEDPERFVNPSQVLAERCATLLANPPMHWEGVWTWDSK